MTRALVLFAAGMAVGAALAIIIGTATAAEPSRSAPVSFAPLPLSPGAVGSPGSPAASGTPRRRLPSERPDADQGDPSPVSTASPTPEPTQRPAAPSVTGVASWYWDGPGVYAAAGPALRTPGWRGRLVLVCGKQSCIEVPLIDACACYQGERVIDLSSDAFAQLTGGELWRGLVTVTVTW